MLQQARRAFNSGDLDTARTLALEAQKANASWGLFEESPDQILADIERKSDTTTITPGSSANPFPTESPESQNVAGNPFAPASNPNAGGNPFAVLGQPKAKANAAPVNENEINKAQANSLMAEAKADAKAGRYQEARQKLQKAEQFSVIYTKFDERPELVLEDVNLMEFEAKSLAQKSANQAAPNVPADPAKREEAQRLLEQARADIRSAQYDAAKAKIEKARQLNVAYTQFDDTPELVSELLKQYQQPQNDVPNFPDFPAPAPTVAKSEKAPAFPPAPAPAVDEANPFAPAPRRTIGPLRCCQEIARSAQNGKQRGASLRRGRHGIVRPGIEALSGWPV